MRLKGEFSSALVAAGFGTSQQELVSLQSKVLLIDGAYTATIKWIGCADGHLVIGTSHPICNRLIHRPDGWLGRQIIQNRAGLDDPLPWREKVTVEFLG